MSRFFKALKRAEQERALLKEAKRRDGKPTEIGSGAGTAVREDPLGAELQTNGGAADLPPVVDRVVSEQFRRVESEPVLMPTGEMLGGIDQHLVSLFCATSFEAEQYRALRHIVEQKHQSANISVVAVSSPEGEDGKTLTAINLAGALAQAPDARVLLVEGDLRRPCMIEYLGLGYMRGKGLVDAIVEPNLSLEDVVIQCPRFGLALLPAGRPLTSCYEVLQSPRFEELLNEARRRYDYIILDTPPLIPLPDCRLIGKLVDGFLVVVAAHKTPRKLLEAALNVLDPTKIVGLIFNSDDRAAARYYSRYDQSPNDDSRGWVSRVGKTVGNHLRFRRP